MECLYVEFIYVRLKCAQNWTLQETVLVYSFGAGGSLPMFLFSFIVKKKNFSLLVRHNYFRTSQIFNAVWRCYDCKMYILIENYSNLMVVCVV